MRKQSRTTFQYRSTPEPRDSRTRLWAAHLNTPMPSITMDMAMVDRMVRAAPPTMSKRSSRSPGGTMPRPIRITAPAAAGTASLSPLGLQMIRMTAAAKTAQATRASNGGIRGRFAVNQAALVLAKRGRAGQLRIGFRGGDVGSHQVVKGKPGRHHDNKKDHMVPPLQAAFFLKDNVISGAGSGHGGRSGLAADTCSGFSRVFALGSVSRPPRVHRLPPLFLPFRDLLVRLLWLPELLWLLRFRAFELFWLWEFRLFWLWEFRLYRLWEFRLFRR